MPKHKSVNKSNKSFLIWLAETKKEVSFLLRHDKELEVLLIISRFEEGVTKHRLEEEANVNGKRLNEILARLRLSGLIKEENDKKRHWIFLTEKGEEVIELIVNFSRIEV